MNVENTLQIEEKLWSSLEAMRLLENKYKKKIQHLKDEFKENGLISESELNMDTNSTFSEVSKLAESWWETTHTCNLNNLSNVFGKSK